MSVLQTTENKFYLILSYLIAPPMNTQNRHDANFTITGGIGGYHNLNGSHQWRDKVAIMTILGFQCHNDEISRGFSTLICDVSSIPYYAPRRWV